MWVYKKTDPAKAPTLKAFSQEVVEEKRDASKDHSTVQRDRTYVLADQEDTVVEDTTTACAGARGAAALPPPPPPRLAPPPLSAAALRRH